MTTFNGRALSKCIIIQQLSNRTVKTFDIGQTNSIFQFNFFPKCFFPLCCHLVLIVVKTAFDINGNWMVIKKFKSLISSSQYHGILSFKQQRCNVCIKGPILTRTSWRDLNPWPPLLEAVIRLCTKGCQMVYIVSNQIPIRVNFGGSCNGRCWHILSPFGLFYNTLVHFMSVSYNVLSFGIFYPFWYVWYYF
jgi:hypothetical protein